MNWDQVEGQWKNLRGSVREKWAKITDSDYDSVAGKKDRLVGLIQERYGIAKEKVEQEVQQFFDRMSENNKSAAQH